MECSGIVVGGFERSGCACLGLRCEKWWERLVGGEYHKVDGAWGWEVQGMLAARGFYASLSAGVISRLQHSRRYVVCCVHEARAENCQDSIKFPIAIFGDVMT